MLLLCSITIAYKPYRVTGMILAGSFLVNVSIYKWLIQLSKTPFLGGPPILNHVVPDLINMVVITLLLSLYKRCVLVIEMCIIHLCFITIGILMICNKVFDNAFFQFVHNEYEYFILTLYLIMIWILKTGVYDGIRTMGYSVSSNSVYRNIIHSLSNSQDN